MTGWSCCFFVLQGSCLHRCWNAGCRQGLYLIIRIVLFVIYIFFIFFCLRECRRSVRERPDLESKQIKVVALFVYIVTLSTLLCATARRSTPSHRASESAVVGSYTVHPCRGTCCVYGHRQAEGHISKCWDPDTSLMNLTIALCVHCDLKFLITSFVKVKWLSIFPARSYQVQEHLSAFWKLQYFTQKHCCWGLQQFLMKSHSFNELLIAWYILFFS